MAGRTPKKGADYFTHDTNCLTSPTVETLRNKYGNDGYAVWFMTLELLGNEPEFYLDLQDSARWEWYAGKMGCEELKLKAILSTLANFGAIDKELLENGIIWSDSFVGRLVPMLSKRAEGTPQKPVLGNSIPVPMDNSPVDKPMDNSISASEMPISASEMPISASEMPISSTLLYNNIYTLENKQTISERETITPLESIKTIETINDSVGENIPAIPPPKKAKVQDTSSLIPLVSEYAFPDPVKDSILEWLEYKHERKDKYTPTGFRSQLKQIEKHVKESGGAAVCDVIQQSMANGWMGICWDRISTRASPGGFAEPQDTISPQLKKLTGLSGMGLT